MNDKHDKTHKKPPAPDLREVRRQLMAQIGALALPDQQAADPTLLAAGLNMCASAGLPDPVITVESVSDGVNVLDVTVYVFTHFRIPQLACRVTEDEMALYPDRIVQICKNAGIRADSLAITDDPPIAA